MPILRRAVARLGVCATIVALAACTSRTGQPTPGAAPRPHGAAAAMCNWESPAPLSPLVKDLDPQDLIITTGTPPAVVPRTGTATMTIATNRGDIVVSLDLAKTPCTAAAFRFLAGQSYFDSTKCHRLTVSSIYVLQCGDPTGSGAGEPQFRGPDEFGVQAKVTLIPSRSGMLMHMMCDEDSSMHFSPAPGQPSLPATFRICPDLAPGPCPPGTSGRGCTEATDSGIGPVTAPQDMVTYKRGVVAMANSGPNTNGSQFFFVYRDSPMNPSYTQFGTVLSGMPILDEIADGGVQDTGGVTEVDGAPAKPLVIKSLTVTG